jgi:hypothetical protein
MRGTQEWKDIGSPHGMGERIQGLHLALLSATEILSPHPTILSQTLRGQTWIPCEFPDGKGSEPSGPQFPFADNGMIRTHTPSSGTHCSMSVIRSSRAGAVSPHPTPTWPTSALSPLPQQ